MIAVCGLPNFEEYLYGPILHSLFDWQPHRWKTSSMAWQRRRQFMGHDGRQRQRISMTGWLAPPSSQGVAYAHLPPAQTKPASERGPGRCENRFLAESCFLAFFGDLLCGRLSSRWNHLFKGEEIPSSDWQTAHAVLQEEGRSGSLITL